MNDVICVGVGYLWLDCFVVLLLDFIVLFPVLKISIRKLTTQMSDVLSKMESRAGASLYPALFTSMMK